MQIDSLITAYSPSMSSRGSDTAAIAICRTASRHAGASFDSIRAGSIASGARSVHQAWWNRAPCNVALDVVIETIKKRDARDHLIVHAFSPPTFPWTAAGVLPCS